MMNEKCAACIHCEVCGFIESEVAKDGACDFYEDGERWELTKEEKALLQKWRDNRGISMKDFEDAMDALEQEPCEDAISRQAILDGLSSIAKAKAKSDAQKSLMGRVMFFTEQLPPVTPKYTDAEIQKMQDLEQAEIQKAYELGKTEVLDKIKAEIEALTKTYPFVSTYVKEDDVRKIIDKYKAESEGLCE